MAIDVDGEMATLFTLYMKDTVAAKVRAGSCDIQGIPWHKKDFTREQFRNSRLEQYENDEDVKGSGERANLIPCKSRKKVGKYYTFSQHKVRVIPTVQHYMYRDLIYSTSKHDVYVAGRYRVNHWSALTLTSDNDKASSESTPVRTPILDLYGDISEEKSTRLMELMEEGHPYKIISTMAVYQNLLIVGGIVDTELTCTHLNRPGDNFYIKIWEEEEYEPIAEYIEIFKHPSGAICVMVSISKGDDNNTEGNVKDFDVETSQLLNHLHFPWYVNHTSLSPDGNQLVIVGENPEGRLVDSQTGEIIAPLSGHFDYSHSSAWHPNGNIFVTGNQDKTCRIWDVRNLSNSVEVLKGNIAGIDSLHFTSDGQFMAMAEAVDFVHVYDAQRGFEKEQEIDLFGHISGLSFNPDTESLFIGVTEPGADTRPSLLLYHRILLTKYAIVDNTGVEQKRTGFLISLGICKIEKSQSYRVLLVSNYE